MSVDLYHLPGRRSERQRVRWLLLLGLAASFGVGAFFGAQWIAHNLAHHLPPIADLTDSALLRLLRFWLLPALAFSLWKRRLLVLPLLSTGAIVTWSSSFPLFSPWEAFVLPADDSLRMQAVVISILLALPFAVLVWIPSARALAALPKHGDAHGSARFADDGDVRRSGLLDGTGIAVGQYQEQA